MKRFMCILLTISFVFVLAACGNNDTKSQIEADNSSYTFVKPETYASVILVTVNPQFKVYLNSSNEVIAVEPVNDDAKSIINDITEQTGNLETVIENISTAINKGGFVKDTETAEVKIEIVEIKNAAVNTDTILDEAKEAADKIFEEMGIQAEVNTSVAEDANDGISSSTAEASSAEATSSEAVESKPTHTHSYAAATCTKPKTCSCGATEGKALGHSYKEGICTRCSAKDANYVPTAVSKKDGKWKLGFIGSDGCYYRTVFTLCGTAGFSVGIGDPLSTLSQEMQNDIRNYGADSIVALEGKEFYIGKGDGCDVTVTEENNTVTVIDMNDAKLVLTRTDENTMTIQEAPAVFLGFIKFSVGQVLTFSAN